MMGTDSLISIVFCCCMWVSRT